VILTVPFFFKREREREKRERERGKKQKKPCSINSAKSKQLKQKNTVFHRLSFPEGVFQSRDRTEGRGERGLFQSTAEKGAETRIERRESEKKQRDVISTFVFKKKKKHRDPSSLILRPNR
jgi:hypothetical protein